MDSKLQRYCDGLLEAGWLAAVVVTPLFFNIHSSRVFEPDKLTLLRSIAVLMAAVWLIKFIDRQGWRSMGWISWRNKESIWRMPFVLPAFLLAIVYLISTVFSITPVVSWAGSYQRLQGTYTTLSYITIFALMLATIRDRAQVSRVVTTVIVTSIPVALYALLQHYTQDPLPWGGDTRIRVAGSMGNSIFIAAYLIMVVPLTLARIIDAFTNVLTDEELDAADIVRSAIYIFALAIQMIAVYWTRSRGPGLSFIVSVWAFGLILLVTLRNAGSDNQALKSTDAGKSLVLVLIGTLVPLVVIGVFLSKQVSDLVTFGLFIGSVVVLVGLILILALAGRAWRWLWLAWIFLSMALVVFLVVFNAAATLLERYGGVPVIGDTVAEVASWRELPEVGRFGSLLESQSGSGRVRVLIWEGSLDLLGMHEPLEWPDGHEDALQSIRPLIGYGPESMYVAYNRFYPPELATIEARNASPDRAHNETFDALVITGFAGFLVWQFLYLSVFYYGFRWLGVVRSNRDRNVLIGLWIGGAILVGGLFTGILGLPFVGVAVPFGAIVGLVVYLIYYAIFSRSGGEDEQANPFGTDRLVMIGLVTAILAHYVEIHFGIAIAATRVHFFVYVALMFMVGYFLPKMNAAEPAEEAQNKKKSRKVRRATPRTGPAGWTSPVLAAAFVLALIIGILAFNFTTFSLPPGQTIVSIEDVPTAGEIFRQSFFVNAQKGFQDSPFVFLLLVLSWLLGSLLYISELAKRGAIGLTGAPSNTIDKRVRQGAYVLFALTIVSVAVAIIKFVSAVAEPSTMLGRLGFWLALLYAALCLFTGLGLLNKTTTGRNEAGAVSLLGLIFAFPALVAGGGIWAALIGIMAGIALYLLWDRSWNSLYLPVIIIALVSLFVGLAYVFLHAQFIRSGILPPEGVTETTEATVRRVLETEQTAQLLSFFYVFLFAIIAFTGISLGWEKARRAPEFSNSILSLVPALLLLLLASFVVHDTNLQVIQADVVYKRADQWDKQAIRDGDPAMWDNAIAIYEHAIELAPSEDFYYLWLGRAYLERSSVTADTAERAALLRTAEQRLIEAQRINPLNTDHTANLARLNTRWAEIAAEPERQERINIASDYYEAAMSLSPNNAVIINEYARLAFILDQDCDRALALFDRSEERDPFYATTLYDEYEVLRACGDQVETEAGKLNYYELAAETLSEFLSREWRPAQDWLQLAGLYVVLERFDEAFDAYTMASELRGDDLEQWRIDFTLADMYFQEGQLDKAEEFGHKALETAPEELVSQLQEFLDNIVAARGEADG